MTRSSALTFRAAQSGDEQAILDLFGASFERHLPEEVWRWRFLHCPAGPGIVELALDGDRLAAHYAVTPVRLSIDGLDILAGLSGTTMTHPDYRGLGLFPLLAERTYQRMEASGMACVFGFPNTGSHRGFVKDLRWSDIYEVPTFSLPIDSSRTSDEASTHIREIDHFDARFDDLWERARKLHRVIACRNQASLDWRYVANPQSAYRILAYCAGDAVSGYAVVKSYQQRLQIVDLCALEIDVEKELVKGVLALARQLSAQVVDLWLSVHRPLHRELERIGFSNSAPVTYFGARRLGQDLSGGTIEDWRNWVLTMGDSDVY
ncbi:MAG: GNAT family N-acetyltransferase [Bradymonadales bacterium]|nr:GNAT family N-acetyltransferase [Bradymonadales bacterium]